MWHFAESAADTDIDVRFTEPDRQQLGVAIGEVQQMDVTETRQVIEVFAALGRQGGAGIEGKTGSRSGSEDLQKFATVHRHESDSLGMKKAWHSQAFQDLRVTY